MSNEYGEHEILMWCHREMRASADTDIYRRASAILQLIWYGDHRVPDTTYRHMCNMVTAELCSLRDRYEIAVETLRLIKESGALKPHAFCSDEGAPPISEMLNSVLAAECGVG